MRLCQAPSLLMVNCEWWNMGNNVELIIELHITTYENMEKGTFLVTSCDYCDNLSKVSWCIFMFSLCIPLYPIRSIISCKSTKNIRPQKYTRHLFKRTQENIHGACWCVFAKSPLNIALHGSLLWRLLSTQFQSNTQPVVAFKPLRSTKCKF